MDDKIVAIACYEETLLDERFMVGFSLLKEELVQYGLRLKMVLWNNTEVDWNSFSVILVLGMSEYKHHHLEFLEWLGKTENLNLPIYNRPHAVRWNMHKGYLCQLEELGVDIPYTRIISKELKDEDVMLAIREIINKDFTDYIVKPAIGSDGDGVVRANKSDLESKVKHLLASGDVIIQECITCVATNGEISVHFFGGQHNGSCILRRPIDPSKGKIDDAGVIRFIPQSSKVVEVALKAYKAAKSIISPEEDLLYARVDLMEDLKTGRILLNEIEILEPLISYDGANPEAVALAREIAVRIGD